MNGFFTIPLSRELFSLLVLLFSAYGIGALTGIKHAILKFSCGTALLAFMAWSLPTLSGFSFTLLAVLLALSSTFGAYRVFKEFKSEKTFFSLALFFFAFSFGSYALWPYSWDECVYQTALLKHYANAGNNAVVPDNPFSFFPSLPHSLMRLGMSVAGGGIRLARMLSGAVMAISLAAVISKIRECGTKRALFIAFAVVLSPVTLVLARANYAEQYILLFAIAGVICIFEYRKNPLFCAVFTALFAAAAVCVKLTGTGVALTLGILYLALCRKKNIVPALFAGIAVFVIFCMPFFLRPLMAKSNPFYPFADWYFSSDTARILVSRHHHLLGSYRYGMGFISGLCYGWLFTAFDSKIFDGISTGWQFPLILTTGILSAFYLKKTGSYRRKTAFYLQLGVLTLYVFWAATSQQSRFMLPLMVLAAAATAFNLKGLPEKMRSYVCIAIFIAAVIPFPQAHLKHFVTAWKIVPSIDKNPIHFLSAATRDKGYFEMAEFLAKTPENSKILLLLNERRTLYLPRKAVIGEPFFQERNTPVPQNAETLWNNIKEFDYIVVSAANNNPDAQQSTQSELMRLAGLIQELSNTGKLQSVFSDSKGEYFIFRCGETATGATL